MRLSLKNIFGIVFVSALIFWVFGRLISEADTHAWYEFSYWFYDILWLMRLDWLWTFSPEDIKMWNSYSYNRTTVDKAMGFAGFMLSSIVHIASFIVCGFTIFWFFDTSSPPNRRR